MIMEKQWEATDRVTATKTQIKHKFNYFTKHHVTNMYQNNE